MWTTSSLFIIAVICLFVGAVLMLSGMIWLGKKMKIKTVRHGYPVQKDDVSERKIQKAVSYLTTIRDREGMEPMAARVAAKGLVEMEKIKD